MRTVNTFLQQAKVSSPDLNQIEYLSNVVFNSIACLMLFWISFNKSGMPLPNLVHSMLQYCLEVTLNVVNSKLEGCRV